MSGAAEIALLRARVAELERKRSAAEIREMLRAMQAGELTVSRGIELVDMWLAGNYRDDMLPPVRDGLGEDEMPWDRIDSLTQQVRDWKDSTSAAPDQLIAKSLLKALLDERDALKQQRDELTGLLRESVATLRMWKDVAPAVSLCAAIDAAIELAKQPFRSTELRDPPEAVFEP